MNEPSELEKCNKLTNDYLKKYSNTDDIGMKAMYFDKAVYWSIEADIESYWENFDWNEYFKRKENDGKSK